MGLCVCMGCGTSAVYTVHSLRVQKESYGTSILRQGVMQKGGEKGGRVGD